METSLKTNNLGDFYMSDYKVRRLSTKDLFTMTKIMSKISGDVRDGLKDLQIKAIDQQLFGIIVIEAAMKHAETDMKALLADLIGTTVEEFEKEPFDAPITILEKVADQENLKDFFSKVQGLQKKFFGQS